METERNLREDRGREEEELLLLRDSLVGERISGILEENADTTARKAYWRQSVLLARGQKAEDYRFADYAVCREIFGDEQGRYSCLLFAQLMLIPGQPQNRCERELACASRELFAEVYRMAAEGEEAAAIRDTLYWFYSDYCALCAEYQLRLISRGSRLCFGGPMLLMEQELYEAAPVWEQHREDCGLYMGNRYQERYVQAASGLLGDFEKTVFESFLSVFPQGGGSLRQGGFCMSGRQRECIEKMIGRIRVQAHSFPYETESNERKAVTR